MATANHAAQRRPLWGRLFIAIIYAGLALLIIYPISAIFHEAFFNDTSPTLSSIVKVLGSGRVITALGNTLLLSFLSLVGAGFFGIMLAWLVGRTNIPFKRILDPLNMIPFYLSSVVGGISWQVVASSRTGLLNTMIEPVFGPGLFNIYSMGGMALVLSIYYAPFIYLFTLGSLQNMDASLEEAARMSGSSRLKTAWIITLPLSAPSILSACLLVFVSCMGTFGIPLLLGLPAHIETLTTLIYGSINDYPADYATASVLGLALLIMTMILVLLQHRFLAGKRFTTVTGKGFRPRTVDLGAWRWLAFAINLFYLTLVLLPFVALLLVSLQRTWVGAFSWNQATFENYSHVLFTDAVAKRGFVNSAIISTVGATLSVVVCFTLALVMRRTSLPGRRGIMTLALLPMTVPGIVLGIGFLMVLVVTPLYGTIWAIMLAEMIHFLPLGIRNTDGLLQSLSRELDECARMSRANWRQAMMRIVLPLATPGLASLWILLFVIFIREVSASMMLFTYGTETLSIALIQIMQYETAGVAAAFGILQTVILLVCVTLLRLIPTKQVTLASETI